MAKIEYIWPITEDWNHLQILSVIQRKDVVESWNLISRTIKEISWSDVLELHQAEYSKGLSISRALSETLSLALIKIGAKTGEPIFSDPAFKRPFIIEKMVGKIAIDFAFGHVNEIPWKLSRLALSATHNDLDMVNQCTMGILILPMESLRITGKFDSPCNWERAVQFLKAMGGQWKAPLLLIGIKDPKIFEITDNGKGTNPRSIVKLV